MKKHEDDLRRYLTLPEVAKLLGLGKVRRARKAAAATPVSENERLARPVRRLIQRGELIAELDGGGTYLVRYDRYQEYADRREAAALRRQREAKGSEWPGKAAAPGGHEGGLREATNDQSNERKSKRISRAGGAGQPLGAASESGATTHVPEGG